MKDFLLDRLWMIKSSIIAIFQKENIITLSFLFYMPFWWHVLKWLGLLNVSLVQALSLDMSGLSWIVVTSVLVLTLASCVITYQGLTLFNVQDKLFKQEDQY